MPRSHPYSHSDSTTVPSHCPPRYRPIAHPGTTPGTAPVPAEVPPPVPVAVAPAVPALRGHPGGHRGPPLPGDRPGGFGPHRAVRVGVKAEGLRGGPGRGTRPRHRSGAAPVSWCRQCQQAAAQPGETGTHRGPGPLPGSRTLLQHPAGAAHSFSRHFPSPSPAGQGKQSPEPGLGDQRAGRSSEPAPEPPSPCLGMRSPWDRAENTGNPPGVAGSHRHTESSLDLPPRVCGDGLTGVTGPGAAPRWPWCWLCSSHPPGSPHHTPPVSPTVPQPPMQRGHGDGTAALAPNATQSP
ncbi:PREDICTED: basic proline-rich protein-like [Ficedula albicollis]|uniref:basic proline-rich protein-like n=1 Tax=Ficedula albicollis TaxID=59894 RepID=UPI0007AD856C|nr:PREDICTED: basic proline-rich protein-like [Ficedula albicollis]